MLCTGSGAVLLRLTILLLAGCLLVCLWSQRHQIPLVAGVWCLADTSWYVSALL